MDDKVPPSPGNDFFWVRGYWNYSPAARNYTWLAGAWEQQNSDWVLAPASYVWRPSGYVFVPIYWDYPLDQRGSAYTCGAPGGVPVVIAPEVIIERLWVWWPDYVFIYWHWWHFHPGFWDDCWCAIPWWGWNDWWAFGWGDLWGLWWWWGHPDFFPPFWIHLALSNQLPPPSFELIELLKNVPKPNFPIVPGDELLRPKGPEDAGPLPKPEIPGDVTPGGTVTIPEFPDEQPPRVTPPAPPAQEAPRAPPRDYIPPRGYRPPGQYIPQPSYPEARPPSYETPRPEWPRPRPRPTWPGGKPSRPPSTTPETPQYPPGGYQPGGGSRPGGGYQPGGTYQPGGGKKPNGQGQTAPGGGSYQPGGQLRFDRWPSEQLRRFRPTQPAFPGNTRTVPRVQPQGNDSSRTPY